MSVSFWLNKISPRFYFARWLGEDKYTLQIAIARPAILPLIFIGLSRVTFFVQF